MTLFILMESTLDIRVKQRRLFCAPSVIIIWKLFLALHRTQPAPSWCPAHWAAVKKHCSMFLIICFRSELIPEISQK